MGKRLFHPWQLCGSDYKKAFSSSKILLISHVYSRWQHWTENTTKHTQFAMILELVSNGLLQTERCEQLYVYEG